MNPLERPIETWTLELKNVSLFPRVSPYAILQNISLAVRSGSQARQPEILALIGRSGSGKTSLLRLLNRLEEPSQGRIELNGRELRDWPVVNLRRQVVWLPQALCLLGMTVRETLTYPLTLQSFSRSILETRLEQCLKDWQIPQDWLDRQEPQLSFLQRQRVTIARALMLRPRFLLWDQPSVGDSRESENSADSDFDALGKLVTHLHQISQTEGMGVILATATLAPPLLMLLQQFSTRVVFLHQGQLLWDQPSAQVNWADLQEALTQSQEDLNSEWDEIP